MRKVFLEDLPRYRFGKCKINGEVDWFHSIGYKVRFIYDDIEGYLEVVDYDGSNLKIKYKNNTNVISRSSFQNNKIKTLVKDELINLFIENKYGFVNLTKCSLGTKGIDWQKSIGLDISFKYKDVTGDLKLEEYDKTNQKVKIKYNNRQFEIYTDGLLKIQLGCITGHITKEYRYHINEIIRNVKIIKLIEVKNGGNKFRKGYIYQCVKCGYEGETSEGHLRNERDRGICPCCSTPCRKVVQGINDIATTHPHLIKYFKNIEDTYTKSAGCNDKAWMICPDCGFEKKMTISNLEHQKFGCNRCGDNKSYGEKLMFSLLSNLIGSDYKNEKSFPWSNNKRYDFYIQKLGVIIEIHGKQHYSINGFQHLGGRTLGEEQANDEYKKQLAITNGIKEENYIVINCRKSNLEFIKQNILNSKLNKIFDLSKIDWLKCEELSLSSRVKIACDLWDSGIDNLDIIAERMNSHRQTIRIYLNKGKAIGCTYDGKAEQLKAIKRANYKNSIKVICINTGKIFSSIAKASRIYGINETHIGDCCRNKRKSCGRLLDGTPIEWMYYNKYINEIEQAI